MSGLISQGGTSVQIADKLKAFDSLDTLGSSRHLESSIKGKVKKKNLSRGWNFSTFAAHVIEQDLF